MTDERKIRINELMREIGRILVGQTEGMTYEQLDSHPLGEAFELLAQLGDEVEPLILPLPPGAKLWRRLPLPGELEH